ncbi:MAG TPA: branched-chain amino acid ABC transporter permease [Burkholderiales bacterium]|nr:branched-chain amino acid ABC transporter permease [Burkholderiales bacterium]
MTRTRVAWIVAVAVIVVLAALPFLAEKFTVQFATRVLIMAIFAMSLNLLVGQAGLVSLGHAAFYGTGAYALALLSPQYAAANFWWSLPVCMLVAGALALVIGALVLRTGGIFFIMATLAFSQMLVFLLHDTSIAGGSDGMYINMRPDAALFGWRPFDLEKFSHFYFVVLALFVLAFGMLARLRASMFGRVLEGIRLNEPRMRSLGFATFRHKLAAFAIAGMLAGLAGFLGAAQFGVVNPDMVGWHLSGAVLVMVLFGGMSTHAGPVIGAAALLLLELGLQSLPATAGFDAGKHWQLTLGIVIVLVALWLPKGIVRVTRDA